LVLFVVVWCEGIWHIENQLLKDMDVDRSGIETANFVEGSHQDVIVCTFLFKFK